MSEEKQDVEKLLREGNTVQFPITGWSMYPFLRDQDLVTVEPIGTDPIKPYEAVLFRRINGPLVLHRVMKITEEGIFCAGDNQSVLEGPLSSEQILGRMIEYEHDHKHVSVHSGGYRIKSKVWVNLFSVRRMIQKTVHALKTSSHHKT